MLQEESIRVTDRVGFTDSVGVTDEIGLTDTVGFTDSSNQKDGVFRDIEFDKASKTDEDENRQTIQFLVESSDRLTDKVGFIDVLCFVKPGGLENQAWQQQLKDMQVEIVHKFRHPPERLLLRGKCHNLLQILDVPWVKSLARDFEI